MARRIGWKMIHGLISYEMMYMTHSTETKKVAKESEDMTFSIMKEKFLPMVESEKATIKDYTKLVVTDEMIDYVLEKYRNKWKCEDEIAYVILEDLWLKYGKDDKVKGKVHDIQNRLGKLDVDLARAIKARQVDDLNTLDFENRIKKLKEDFGRLLKAKKAKEAKKSKKAKEVKLTKEAKEAKKEELKAKEAKEAKKAKEAELKAKKAKEAELKAKEAMLAELKAKNAKEAMLAEVVQISSDEDDDDEEPTASTSTRSRAPIASTSIPQAASTAL
ncbi:hypothetical protein Tco_0920256 [Tanacetum coccineum]